MSERKRLLKVADTLDGFRKAAVKVIFPVPEQSGPDEFIQMHWCDKCKKYHKAA